MYTEDGKLKIKEGFIGQRMVVLPPGILKKVNANSLINNFYLTAIGYYPHAIYHDRQRKHGSQQYILLYCVEGSGTVYAKGKLFSLHANSYFIIPKMIPHHYASSEKNPWSIYWVHFVGEKADLLYEKYLDSKVPEVKSIPYNENLVSLFSQSIWFMESGFIPRNLEISSMNLFHFLFLIIYHADLHPSSVTENPVSNSIAFMKANLQQIFSIKDLASQQNYSVSHYSELFKQKTGFTPIQYFNQLKIQRSCQYLCFTSKNIKELSNELGFEDPYYFSRLFKKVMGLPPLKYKQIYKVNIDNSKTKLSSSS